MSHNCVLNCVIKMTIIQPYVHQPHFLLKCILSVGMNLISLYLICIPDTLGVYLCHLWL